MKAMRKIYIDLFTQKNSVPGSRRALSSKFPRRRVRPHLQGCIKVVGPLERIARVSASVICLEKSIFLLRRLENNLIFNESAVRCRRRHGAQARAGRRRQSVTGGSSPAGHGPVTVTVTVTRTPSHFK